MAKTLSGQKRDCMQSKSAEAISLQSVIDYSVAALKDAFIARITAENNVIHIDFVSGEKFTFTVASV